MEGVLGWFLEEDEELDISSRPGQVVFDVLFAMVGR